MLLFLGCIALASGQNPNIKAGDKTPDLVITDYIHNVPKDKNFSKKFKIVEFWATWCGPCIAAIPHINQLQNKYKDNPNLVFISISDESPEKIKKTIAKIDFQTIVVSDQSKQSHKNLIMDDKNNYGIPATILIDDQNVIQWIGDPSRLNSELIDAFLNRQIKHGTASATNKTTGTDETANARISCGDFLKIYRSEDIKLAMILNEKGTNPNFTTCASYWDLENRKIVLFDRDIKSILAILKGVVKYRIEVADEIAHLSYNFMYKNENAGGDKVEGPKEVEAYFLNNLRLKETSTSVEKEVYLLKVKDPAKLKENENKKGGAGRFGSSKEFLTITNQSLGRIANDLYTDFKIIVIDDTNLEGKYDFLLKIGSLDVLINELEAYGLTLVKSIRSIPVFKYEQLAQ